MRPPAAALALSCRVSRSPCIRTMRAAVTAPARAPHKSDPYASASPKTSMALGSASAGNAERPLWYIIAKITPTVTPIGMTALYHRAGVPGSGSVGLDTSVTSVSLCSNPPPRNASRSARHIGPKSRRRSATSGTMARAQRT